MAINLECPVEECTSYTSDRCCDVTCSAKDTDVDSIQIWKTYMVFQLGHKDPRCKKLFFMRYSLSPQTFLDNKAEKMDPKCKEAKP